MSDHEPDFIAHLSPLPLDTTPSNDHFETLPDLNIGAQMALPQLPLSPPLHPMAMSGLQPSLQTVPDAHGSMLAAEPQALPSDPTQWSVQQVMEYVTSLGLGHLVDRFERNGVDGEQLLDLTHSDLEEDLEIDREDEIYRLLTAIYTLHEYVRRPDENGAEVPETKDAKKALLPPTGAATANGNGVKQEKRKREEYAPDMDVSKRPRHLSWIATIESWVLEHESYCKAYRRHERPQRNGPEPGICCRNLVSGAQFSMRLVPDSNSCCGVSDSITLTNTATNAVVGTLPCSLTRFLGPLMTNNLVQLSGSITNLVHPAGGVPPFSLSIEADIPRMIALRTDAAWMPLLTEFRKVLEGYQGEWIQTEYTPEVREIVQSLR